MSDVFKWIFATILLYAMTTSPMLMAQETPPVENASAQQPEERVPDDLKDPQLVAPRDTADSTRITLELPADPALIEPFRRMADAIAALRKEIQVRDAGTSASSPGTIEAELRLRKEVPFDIVERLIGDLVGFGIAHVRLSGSFEDQNMIVIHAPAHASWRQIHDLETFLAKLEGFRFDVRVRANDAPPTATTSDVTLPEPAQNPITVYYLRHAEANQALGMIQLLYPGKAEAIVADERSNSLFIRADDKQIREIEKYIEILDQDVSAAGDGKAEEPFNPLAAMMGGGGSPFGGDEFRGNRSNADSPEGRVFLDALRHGGFGGSRSHADTPSSNTPAPTVTVDDEQPKIFHLQNSNADQIAAVIEQLFGGAIVTVAVDARTNTLIVRSSEPLLQQIEAILLRLDEQPGKLAPIASSTTGTAANSTIAITPDPTSTSESPVVPIAEYRRRLNELEQPLLQLAEKVRSTEASLGNDHPESLKQRASLRESIQKTFTARQEIQRAELAEFARRLQGMQQSVDSRDLIADKIVERRLEELLNPEASWNAHSSRADDSPLRRKAATSAEENYFPATNWRPKSEAEKAIGRLVLVFFEDKARRAVPALLIQHGQETIALTAGPATIVPENIEHAIDRTFLEFYDRDDVPTTYADLNTPDLAVHIAKAQLTSFQLENPVTLRAGDVLSAILMHGQADFEVTANAARVTAVEQKTTWQLPSHELNREFIGLIQIDRRLPEGTPLFTDGQLAGITLLGTRFMKDDVPGSYVVPASRIVEVLQQLKTE